MAITLIQPKEMSAYLENPKGYEVNCSPKMALLLRSLAVALQNSENNLPEKYRQPLKLKVPAYYCDSEEEIPEAYRQMEANGHYVRFKYELKKDFPPAKKEDVDKLVRRAKGTKGVIEDGNCALFLLIAQYGPPYYQTGLDMFNDLGDWYEAYKKFKQGLEPPPDVSTGYIIDSHVAPLYSNIRPWRGTPFQKRPNEVSWAKRGHEATIVVDNIDNAFAQLYAWGEELIVSEYTMKTSELLINFESCPDRFKWKSLKIIEGFRALGLVPADYGAKEEAQLKERGLFIPGTV